MDSTDFINDSNNLQQSTGKCGNTGVIFDLYTIFSTLKQVFVNNFKLLGHFEISAPAITEPNEGKAFHCLKIGTNT